MSCYTPGMRIASLAVAIASLAACYGAAGPATTPTNKVARPEASQYESDPLAFLPLDSELVVDVDVAKLRTSPRWADQLQPLIVNFVGGRIEQIRQQCGIDLLQTTSRFAAGMKKTTRDFGGVMVLRGPDAPATMKCVEKLIGPKLVTHDRDTLVVGAGTSDATAFRAVGPRTLVLQTDPVANRATLEAVIAAGAPIRGSAAFMPLYERIDPAAALAIIANGSSPSFEQLGSFGFAPHWLELAVTVTENYVLAARATMADAANATKLVTVINGNSGPVRALVERLEVRAEDAAVKVDATVTADQVKTMLGMVGFNPGP